jgi:carboxymethylenebutenolidase
MRIAMSFLSIALLACAAPSRAASPAAAPTPTAASAALPPGEDGAKDRLNTSPRHGEVVAIDAHGTPVRTWIVYPQRPDKAPVIVVIHEIFGLTDWIRAVADQLAADGFIAVAPDLLSGKGPGGGGTDAYPSRDDVTKAVSGLAPDEVMARLDAVRAYAAALPASSGKTATIGFCWGGGTSFAYAAERADLAAAVVYYGVPPADLGTLAAPVLGLYGGDDARVTSTVEATRTKAAEAKKSYDPHVFPGAGHGFLRAQGQAANLAAAREAWPLTIAFLRDHTR